MSTVTHDSKTTDKEVFDSTIPSSPNSLSKHFHEFLIKILRYGKIPRHIGFIMDGNRRFARKINVQTTEGHYMGFLKMEEVLDICLQLGVKVVTVYAFSIENFKRPKEEVDALMHLAKTKLIELCQSQTVKKYGVCVRILGNMSYVSQDLREVIEEAVEMTKDNNRSILNVCFSYTSRDEITNSVKTIVKMVENKQIQVEDIDENLIEKCLFTHGCPPLEILIRTSGEIRLSDFLLWQCHQDCHIHFENCYWPEFSIWKMLQIILEYQLAN
ncbi:hypothetical protein RclHR1_12150004 [Rhizophagus clarus]|uniref:Alkyl transferase n=1 Tax=Rhizophagus clarus TaxID=94130 RepID=A0A2Z6QIQ9_9GLOM|nr:hypothetical protein RclHR1_12150004 [Rhizophagus clarus]GES74088.1 dehydrodolichyl diphosphate syntase complex subunit DHDDS [Rhizophagus clarus]